MNLLSKIQDIDIEELTSRVHDDIFKTLSLDQFHKNVIIDDYVLTTILDKL